jgi:metallophosphoesterase (TIGR00282 family)
MMKVLIVGDVVGKGGRRAVAALVPELRREYGAAFCVINGENIAGGAGITANCAKSLLRAGADVITTGDHIWDQRTFRSEIQGCKTVLRPANLPLEQPGRGYGIFKVPIGGNICVISLLGRVFMGLQSNCPFAAADRILKEVEGRTNTIIVDFHAEATSEKIAMGRFLDGRVTAVFGTHTHVPTADEQIFPGETAYITDVGMVGGASSILGRAIPPVVQRFSTGMPARFTVVEDEIVLHGAVVTFDQTTGRASAIERLRREHHPELGATNK